MPAYTKNNYQKTPTETKWQFSGFLVKQQANKISSFMENKPFNNSPDEFSIRLKAGKHRTYFFDVKRTKQNDAFIVLTESRLLPNGAYEKSKLHLYREDFNKFLEALDETFSYIENKADTPLANPIDQTTDNNPNTQFDLTWD